MLHIGNLIKAEMKRQERTPVWLARKLHCRRQNIYYIYEQKSLNTELIIRISKALKVDFFKIISQYISTSE